MSVCLQHPGLQSLPLEPLPQFRHRGGLSLPVQPDHEDPLLPQPQFTGLAEDADQFLVDDSDDVFPPAHTGRRFLG